MQRPTLFTRLAAAVAPGGTLLVVGHDASDLHTTMPRPGLAEMGWTPDKVTDVLGPGWTVELAQTRPRPAIDPQGQRITINDTVLRAHRHLNSPSASTQRRTDSGAKCLAAGSSYGTVEEAAPVHLPATGLG